VASLGRLAIALVVMAAICLAARFTVLANWDQPAWGWADSRSTWLLEFWREFDPSTLFVLQYTPAYDVLSRVMADTGAVSFDSQALLDTWCAYQTELLRFYNRNRARSVLVHAHLVDQPGTQLVDTINQALGTAFNSVVHVPSDAQAVNPLIHLLVQNVLQNHPAVRALEDEINATLPECKAIQPVPVADTASAIAHLRALHATQAAQLQAQLAQNSASAELKQENELLLLQLHQVQEELEQHFLAKQKLEDQIATTLHEHNALASQNAQRASQERDKYISERQQAQEELQRQQLAVENSRVTAEQLNRAQQELKQENELLLLQLHQVQEELEHYFLQHQQATQEKQMVEAHLNKLLAHYPDHTEWDRVELLSTTVPLRCLIQGIKVGGLSPRAVNLAVDMVGRTPVLVLTPPEHAADQPLRYWPTSQNTGAPDALAPLVLNPLAPPGTESAALLRRLAPSDLQLVRGACTAMAQDLPASQPARDAWVDVIGTLRQQLSQLPPAWRFDTVQLKRQQVNPGYEHLWFELGNVRFGKRHWPTFEFRLSAPDIKKGKFSHLPKLEFPLPLQADKQFENWFDEAQDQVDPHFELRFDTKNKAMDVALWKALSATDQAQALSLCDQLPTLLQRLQAQGVQIARPWEDWQTLAIGLQQALAHCLGLKNLMGNPA
jgi:hypothetical protein